MNAHASDASPLTADTARAVARFLALHGLEVPSSQLLQSLRDDDSADSVAAELSARGLEVRPVEVTRADLPMLNMPALVTLQDRRTFVVLSAQRKRLRVLTEHAESALISLDGTAVFPMRAIEFAGPMPAHARWVRRFLLALRTERAALAHIAMTSILVLGFGLAVPALTRQVLDRALPEGSTELLSLVALSLPILALHRVWLEVLRAAGARRLGARVIATLSSNLMQHIVHLPFAVQQRRSPHELVYALQSAESLAQLFIRVALSPMLDVLSLFGHLAWLMWALPPVAAVAVVSSALVLASSAVTARKLTGLAHAQVPASARQSGFLYEVLAGVVTVKSLGGERACGRRWLERLADEQRLDQESASTSLGHQTLLRLFTRTTSLAMFGWGAHACLHGDLTLGAFLSAAMYADGVMAASMRLGGTIVQSWSSSVLVEQIDDILGGAEEPVRDRRPCAAAQTSAIVLNDVWFRHAPESPWVVRGESLEVERGTVLNLRSPSGSGKTTLLRLMAGLYQPERGQVRIEGRDPRELRHLITYVPQQAHLLEGSVLHNLRVLSRAPVQRVLEASVETGLFEWLIGLPMGYETLVSAGGYNVSGGQRQWIALTAAVASDRPIVLLDEAMCHMDRIRRAQLAASDLFRGKTVVQVSHERDDPRP